MKLSMKRSPCSSADSPFLVLWAGAAVSAWFEASDPPLEPGAEVAPGYTVAALLRRGEDFDTYSAWSVTRMFDA